MSWFRFSSRRTRNRERDEEIRAHLELYAEELVARGTAAEDARRHARLAFGNPRVKLEEVEALDRLPFIETAGHALRDAFRGLRASPGFTAVVLVVLTLAMGASTAVFSVVDAVVLKGLPFVEADRLVTLNRMISGEVVTGPFSASEFLALRARPDLFEALAAVTSVSVVLKRDGSNDPEILRGQRVSAEFYSVLRVAPAIGRPFTMDDELVGRPLVGVISHGLWQRRFGGSSDVLGKRLPAVGGDVEIVGVMSPDFAYPVGAMQPTDLWIPYIIPDKERVAIFSSYLRFIARMKDGATLESAQARLDGFATDAVAGTVAADSRLVIENLQESLIGDTRGWMLMLLGSVTCVLLIACVNIVNLLLVRATVRVRELSVRSALGATRWDLGRMLLAESVLLSTTGTALGTLVAWWGIEGLRAILPPDLPRLADIAIDWRVLAVSASAALVTGVAFGLAPVFHSGKAINQVLKQHGRTDTSSGDRQRLRSTLLVAEVALAVVLLVGAALFLTSFARLMRINVGLDYDHVLVVDVRPATASGRSASSSLTSLLERVQEIPGVQSAGLTDGNLPFSLRTSGRPFGLPGRQLGPDQPRGVNSSEISLNYFQTLGVPLVRGRFFTAADAAENELVAILNESAAKTYFPNEDPIGKLVGVGLGSQTVVGVVGDIRGSGPEREVERAAFVPLREGRFAGGALVIKTDGNNAAIAPQVKAVIWTAFPDIAIPAPRTLEENLGRLIAQRRFGMVLLSLFGLLGVMIAGVGIYGVMTYVVTQRTREIGIRMALGAVPSTILRSVLRRASLQVAVGLVVGLGTAWLLATSVEKFLFRVEPHDLRIYAAVCVVLAATALAAAFVPARRAARVDPLVALRLE